MTQLHKSPAEIEAEINDLKHQLDSVSQGALQPVECSPETIEQGLAKLVPGLLALLRQLLERQAIRGMDGGDFTDEQIEAMGQSLMKLEAKIHELAAFRKLEQLKMERRLIEIEKLAATGRLAGTIAHEVNNPMEAIKNAIFLLQGVMKPEAQPIYEILKSETDRVARLVRQMLGLYRHSEHVGTIDVNTVVEDTLMLFSRQLERSGIRVEKDLPHLPPIVGSPDQFRQVVSNLVINARDSMVSSGEEECAPAAASVLKVRTRHLPACDGIHGWVRLTVADTGAGIPPAIIKTIFEPFVSTKGEKGTGLGLWIVKGIIENHSGKLHVRSRVGRGTVFKIDLPVVR